MILMGNLTFLFCFSTVSLSNSPILSLILVIYCSFLLGSTLNASFQGMLMFLWILIYVGGMMVVFTYCVFFSKKSDCKKLSDVKEIFAHTGFFNIYFLFCLSLKDSWFYLNNQSKFNDNFLFKGSTVNISNMNDKSMFLLGEMGFTILLFGFFFILFILFFTTIIIKESFVKQNLF